MTDAQGHIAISNTKGLQLASESAQELAHRLLVAFPMIRIDLHMLQRLLDSSLTGNFVLLIEGLQVDMIEEAFRKENEMNLSVFEESGCHSS